MSTEVFKSSVELLLYRRIWRKYAPEVGIRDAGCRGGCGDRHIDS